MSQEIFKAEKKIGNWIIDNEVGHGSFGTVYQGIDSSYKISEYLLLVHEINDHDTKWAMKLAPIKGSGSTKKNKNSTASTSLSLESMLYRLYIKNSHQGFAKIPSKPFYGEIIGYKWLVMEYLPYTLLDLIEKQTQFTVTDVCKAGIQLLETIHFLHKKGYVYRDMKPENIMIREDPKEKQLVLVDLGCVLKYRTANEFEDPHKFNGNYAYCSISMHNNIRCTPLDDLIGIAYLLYQLYTNKPLPWFGDKKPREIQQIKEESNILFAKQTDIFSQFITELYSLDKINEKIYNKYIKLFEKSISNPVDKHTPIFTPAHSIDMLVLQQVPSPSAVSPQEKENKKEKVEKKEKENKKEKEEKKEKENKKVKENKKEKVDKKSKVQKTKSIDDNNEKSSQVKRSISDLSNSEILPTMPKAELILTPPRYNLRSLSKNELEVSSNQDNNQELETQTESNAQVPKVSPHIPIQMNPKELTPIALPISICDPLCSHVSPISPVTPVPIEIKRMDSIPKSIPLTLAITTDNYKVTYRDVEDGFITKKEGNNGASNENDEYQAKRVKTEQEAPMKTVLINLGTAAVTLAGTACALGCKTF
ncbi:hypothetical protein WA158_001819 [Blastocystis sp. Blastoise]